MNGRIKWAISMLLHLGIWGFGLMGVGTPPPVFAQVPDQDFEPVESSPEKLQHPSPDNPVEGVEIPGQLDRSRVPGGNRISQGLFQASGYDSDLGGSSLGPAHETDQDMPLVAVGGQVHADLFTGTVTTSFPLDVPPAPRAPA